MVFLHRKYNVKLMKKLVVFFIITTSILSCKVKEKPEFIKIEDIEVTDSNSQFVKLKAKALFKNLNSVGGKLATDSINVFVDGKQMALVTSEEFKVPAKKEFTIPLDIKIETKKLFNKNNLKGILNSLLGEELKVRLKGDIKYKVLGFSHTYHLDKTEDIKVKF